MSAPKRSSELRANLVAIGVLLAVLSILGAFAYRPATVLGVDGETLANSVGEVFGRLGEDCAEGGEGEWSCRISDPSSGPTTIEVTTRSFGCWDAAQRHGRNISGCVNAFHLF